MLLYIYIYIFVLNDVIQFYDLVLIFGIAVM